MPNRTSPALALLIALASPAAAFSPTDPGPTLGGAVGGGTSYARDDIRLDVRLQVWSPPSMLPSPLRLGVEGSFGLGGEEGVVSCGVQTGAGEPRPEYDSPAYSRCLEIAIGPRLLIGAEWGDDLIGRLEAGVGPAWRRDADLDSDEGAATRWSLSLVGRAAGLVAVGEMLGGAWRVGLSLEVSRFDDDTPSIGAGFVFEAVVID